MNNNELATKIVDCISDGYDDEEYRDTTETGIIDELSNLSEDSMLKVILERLCERIEELEV